MNPRILAGGAKSAGLSPNTSLDGSAPARRTCCLPFGGALPDPLPRPALAPALLSDLTPGSSRGSEPQRTTRVTEKALAGTVPFPVRSPTPHVRLCSGAREVLLLVHKMPSHQISKPVTRGPLFPRRVGGGDVRERRTEDDGGDALGPPPPPSRQSLTGEAGAATPSSALFGGHLPARGRAGVPDPPSHPRRPSQCPVLDAGALRPGRCSVRPCTPLTTTRTVFWGTTLGSQGRRPLQSVLGW